MPKTPPADRVATAAPGARQAAGAAGPRGLPAAGGGDRGPGGCGLQLGPVISFSCFNRLPAGRGQAGGRGTALTAPCSAPTRCSGSFRGGRIPPQLLRCRDTSLLRLPNFLAEGTGSTHPPRGRSSQPPRGAPGVTQAPGTGGSGRGAPGAAAAASPALGASQPSRDAAAFGRAPGTGGPAAGGPGGGGGSRGRPRPAPPPPPAPSPAPPEPRPQPGPGVREGPEGQRSE